MDPPGSRPDTPGAPADAVRDELARVLQSRQFQASERLKQFLQFVVERTLEGEAAQLKEYVIGSTVYGRGESFDPKADSIVRTEANRLRSRLAEFYRAEPAPAFVRIVLDKGSYVPAFIPVPPTIALAEQSPRTHLMWRLRLGAAAIGTLLAVLAWGRQLVPAADFRTPDWLLVGQIENRTGETLLDGTLQDALELELNRSRYVNVVPRLRIDDALRLMAKPVETPLSGAVAREVALRDGSIPLVVYGSIARLGKRYVLGLHVIEPTSGRIVRAIREEAETQGALLAAVRRASRSLRLRVGEASATAMTQESLDAVTTTSLRALQLYSRANELGKSGKWATAEQILRQAVIEDPEFGSAHLLLAWALWNQGRPSEEWRSHSDTAQRLAPRATEHERLFTVGSVHSFNLQPEKALAAYDAVLRVRPTHYWALGNATRTVVALDPARAPSYFAKIAELRPHDLQSQISVAWGAMLYANDPLLSARYRERVRKLSEARPPTFFFDTLRAWDAWLAGDLKRAAEVMRPHCVTGMGEPEPVASAWLYCLGAGRTSVVRSSLERLGASGMTKRWLAFTEEATGDSRAFRARARDVSTLSLPNALDAVLMSRAGETDYARRTIAKGRAFTGQNFDTRYAPANWQVAEAELLLAEGHEAKALTMFAQAIPRFGLSSPTITEPFLAADSYATILIKRGSLEGARRVLRHAVHDQRATAFPHGVYFWTRCATRLSALEHHLGNPDQAQALANQLAWLLVDADPEFRETLARITASVKSIPRNPR
jgi:hypothetical protein